MSWARRLKRVFGVQIESCARCGGELKIIASIEEPQLIAKILSRLKFLSAPLAQATSRKYPPGRPFRGMLSPSLLWNLVCQVMS
jgi:hypothetical protein